jgi:hypothetical protein
MLGGNKQDQAGECGKPLKVHLGSGAPMLVQSLCCSGTQGFTTSWARDESKAQSLQWLAVVTELVRKDLDLFPTSTATVAVTAGKTPWGAAADS